MPPHQGPPSSTRRDASCLPMQLASSLPPLLYISYICLGHFSEASPPRETLRACLACCILRPYGGRALLSPAARASSTRAAKADRSALVFPVLLRFILRDPPARAAVTLAVDNPRQRLPPARSTDRQEGLNGNRTGPQTPRMADDGPQLVRPIPRRPFNLNLTRATPPDDDEQDSPPSGFALSQHDLSSPRFLNPSFTPTDAASISRPPSFLNLNSSTLMGIFSQATSNRDRAFIDRDEPDTPWGTGAQTPIKRPSIDNATYELMRDRSHLPRRRSSYWPGSETGNSPPPSAAATALSLTFRAGLLFLLGVGYGVLVTRLHNEQQYLADMAEGIIKPGSNWEYLAFWGVSGVVLGSLLPWFDKVWERAFGSDIDNDAVAGGDGGAAEEELGRGTDWALVMRAIGAFVGIIFAIRKLAWASTLQVSATLALVNPLLWWLIDRSKPGFLLSAGVGLTGSMLLLGVNPEIMPAPSRPAPPHAAEVASHNGSATADAAPAAVVLGGLASQETVETGVWMLSVLFCSCVCFGNIGRRLAWSRSAVGRGRWGGVR
ncbi:hypothetical protein TOPH_03093 [Tolypocladium ophioglossoides CBS 100239]|uniref:Uncharacterized protein n=1 Tax=Tolypocladium ophioglossoides (strain CBS 100239) TaxID=1163406 RepID=A0A0L0NDC3_TOLOC|nr:hypothetical protein TOPH_03093 [Tolypocladium ophioglossoides CBS 100239]